MRRQAHTGIYVLLMGLFILPINALAEDEAALSGEAGITASALNNADDSSRFKEYRDYNPVTGNATIDFGKGSYYLEFRSRDIAEDDQSYNFRVGRYGKYRIELIHDETPHRFDTDAKLLFSGKGTGTLTVDDAIQTALEADGLGSATQRDNLINYMNAAPTTDLKLVRKNTRLNADVTAFYPIKLRVEVGKEVREGERPFGVTFGGHNYIAEIPEPLDYVTDQLKVSAEYIKDSFYLNASYYLSTFHNNIDTLTVDNPYRITDTNAALNGTNGPGRARFDLYPDNRYQNASLTGSIYFPLRSRLSATASWGRMEQNDNLVPYTVNTATTDAELASYCASQLASDPACLPKGSMDGKVDTTLYNALLTSRPLSFMNIKARYRHYGYDNKTERITFPGYVQYDGAWRTTIGQATAIENLPTGYRKTTAGVDLGFDVAAATSLTLGFASDRTERTHREVKDQKDTIYKASLDTMPFEWLDLRTSYEKSGRKGDYDYTVPFAEEFTNTTSDGTLVTAQLPWLRKYDEADRDRERIQLIATLYPTDSISLTGTYIQGKDDFKDSPFGLTEDKHQIYSIDGDYTVNENLNFYAFYSHERYDNGQRSRQWNACNPATDLTTTPGCTGANEGADPYYTQTTFDSFSNWNSENQDRVDTYGGGMKFAAIPEKLDLDLAYSYSRSEGKVRLSSAAETNTGTATNDDLNNYTPVEFSEVDKIKTQTLNAKAKYRFTNNLSLALGYMYEKFEVSDFNLNGFSNVVATTSSSSTGTVTYPTSVFMGTLLKDYDVNIVYTKLAYSF